MTNHERAAMEAAAVSYTLSDRDDQFVYAWEAARKYEPPALCGAVGNSSDKVCELKYAHNGDHRYAIGTSGDYIGWPRI